jgi:IclR family transcriptional regulator, acetate operon repressor
MSSRDPVSKAFALVRFLLDHDLDDVGVREAAGALGTTPSTAHRILAALGREGVLERDDRTGRYSLGDELYRLARLATSRRTLEQVARPVLERLVARFNETTYLFVYSHERRRMMITVRVDCDHPVRHLIQTNRWLRVASGAGLAILAFLPADQREELLADVTARDRQGLLIDDDDKLRAAVRTARQDGYVVAVSHPFQDYVALAVPVLGRTDELVAVIGVATPSTRFDDDVEKHLSRAARDAAAEIAAALT